MNKLVAISAVVLTAGVITGCATTPEDWADAYQEEYTRLAALPPAAPVMSPNRDVADCARLSCDLFNEIHPMMKAYIAKTETSFEYTGFMNDIAYYVKERGMSNQEACKKVADDVIAADATRPDDQKVWPKILKGIQAANTLDPKKQLVQIGILVARNAEIGKSVANLPNAFKNEDYFGQAKRGLECAAISKQLADVTECLVYMGDQYSRVVELEHYTR